MRENTELFSEKQLSRKPEQVSTPFARYVAATWPDVSHVDELERELRERYPRLDLLEQAREARIWEIANPQRRKQRHAMFLANWMRNAERYRQRDVQREQAQAIPKRREIIGHDKDWRPIYAEDRA